MPLLTMPDEISKFERNARLGTPRKFPHPTPYHLLDRVRLAHVVPLQLLEVVGPPPSSLSGGESESHIEDPESDAKGSEDGEEADLDGDSLGATTVPASTGRSHQVEVGPRAGQLPALLLHRLHCQAAGKHN